MFKQIKELGKDSVIYGLGGSISQLLSLFLVPFYTKALRPEDYGILAIAGLFTQFTNPLLSLGLDNALFRFFSLSKNIEEERTYLTTAFFIKMTAAFTCLVLIYFAYPILDKLLFEEKLTYIIFILVLGSVFFGSFGALAEVVIRVQRKPMAFIIIQLIVMSISIVLSIYWVLILEWGVFGALLATFIGLIVRSICLSIYLRNYLNFRYFSISKGKVLLNYALPYVPHKIQGQVMQLFSLFIVTQQMGIAAAGIYSVVNKLVKPFWMIVGSVQKAWVPYKFYLHKTESDPRPVFRSISGNYWMLLILMWSVACLMFPFIFKFLINERYHQGINYFPFLAFIPLAQAFYFTVNTGLELRKSQKILPIATFFGMITVVSVSLITVKYCAPYGPIIAQSLSFLVIAFITFRYARKVIVINYPFLLTLLYLSFSLILVFINYLSGCDLLVSAISITIELILFIRLVLYFNEKSIGEIIRVFSSRKISLRKT